jgi:hypothetical protein
MIDPAHSHTSYGKCKLCGAVREFSNTLIGAFVRRGGIKSDPGINVDDLQVSHQINLDRT